MDRERALGLLPPHLQHYLQERVLVSSWYPETDLMDLLEVLSKIFGGPDPYFFMGRHTANTHLAGIYRGYVKPDGVERSLASGTALWRNYHDTGETTCAIEGPGRAVISLQGFAAATPQFCRLLTGYYTQFTESAGGKDVEVVKIDCCLKKAPACRWRITWS